MKTEIEKETYTKQNYTSYYSLTVTETGWTLYLGAHEYHIEKRHKLLIVALLEESSVSGLTFKTNLRNVQHLLREVKRASK